MGHIRLEKGRLILETNSEEHTQQGKKLFTQYLGDAVDFQQTLIESPEQKLKSLPDKPDENLINSELLELPEVQAHIKQVLKKHWDNWFDEPIPVLDNKTPRDAAKTTVGREQLEALLLQYERYDVERDTSNPLKADISRLRAELALDKFLTH